MMPKPPIIADERSAVDGTQTWSDTSGSYHREDGPAFVARERRSWVRHGYFRYSIYRDFVRIGPEVVLFWDHESEKVRRTLGS